MELPIAAGSPGGPAIPTMICSPSVTRRAMFSPIRSAPSSAPPAALSASAIRAPGFRVTNPGVCTSPTTLTTTGPSGFGAVPGVGLADETICTGGSLAEATGGRSSRIKVNTVTSTAMTPTAASAMTPARPGSARTDASQLADPPDVPSGSHRDNDVSGCSSSTSGSGSGSASAPSRRCRRSAGSSVRMSLKLGVPPDGGGRVRRRAEGPVDQIASVDSRLR
jgi:hypothetical protein